MKTIKQFQSRKLKTQIIVNSKKKANKDDLKNLKKIEISPMKKIQNA